MLDHADYTGPTRQHELDPTRSGIDLSALKDLDHIMKWGSITCPMCEILPILWPMLQPPHSIVDMFSSGTPRGRTNPFAT